MISLTYSKLHGIRMCKTNRFQASWKYWIIYKFKQLWQIITQINSNYFNKKTTGLSVEIASDVSEDKIHKNETQKAQ